MSVASSERSVAGLRWMELGRSERCVWGRCQGSAATPYEVVVTVTADAGEAGRHTCTCPSRRRPCKHVVGLLHAYGAGEPPKATEPPYAREWVERTSREPRPARSAEVRRAPDAEAAAKRAAARRDRVEGGLAELERWLADQVRTGLVAMPRAGYAHVDGAAARLVDAQASGAAAMVRALPGDLVGEGWPERLLHALGAIHLLARSHARLDQLAPELAATVRSRVGYPTTKESVLASPGLSDTWWPVGVVDTVEEQLESRRVWLRGARTGRWGLWLTYAAPGQVLDTTVRPGVPLPARLHFYPGAGQHRAVVGDRLDHPPEPLPRSGVDWAAVDADFARLLAEDPWASRLPVVVRGVPLPPPRGGSWQLRDVSGAVGDLALPGEGWPLLAESGGEPIEVFGEWTGRRLVPLSMLPDDPDRPVVWTVCG